MSNPFASHRSTPAELQARLLAERGGTPFLVLRDPLGAQQIIPLDPAGGAQSIGRDPAADISLSWDGRVSRLHATVEPAAGSWSISDDGLSRNGTAVNLSRVTGRRRLSGGDVIKIGETELLYVDPGSGHTGETALAEDISVDADLSRMQRRVLIELCRPLHRDGPYAAPATNLEIAAAVFLSEAAVKTHFRTLFAKFGLSDLPQNRKRAALAEAALRAGVLSQRDFSG
jgi:pSer/pThr/pTyr-binding forkhead associated (FHA) protein